MALRDILSCALESDLEALSILGAYISAFFSFPQQTNIDAHMCSHNTESGLWEHTTTAHFLLPGLSSYLCFFSDPLTIPLGPLLPQLPVLPLTGSFFSCTPFLNSCLFSPLYLSPEIGLHLPPQP